MHLPNHSSPDRSRAWRRFRSQSFVGRPSVRPLARRYVSDTAAASRLWMLNLCRLHFLGWFLDCSCRSGKRTITVVYRRTLVGHGDRIDGTLQSNTKAHLPIGVMTTQRLRAWIHKAVVTASIFCLSLSPRKGRHHVVVLLVLISFSLSTASSDKLNQYPVPGPRFSITRFGAVGDNATLSTQAFQRAFSACSEAGGGYVEVPPGVSITGQVKLIFP